MTSELRSRVLIGLLVAVVLGATGCSGDGDTSANTPAQVKQAFAAEGIRLVVWPAATSREDELTTFKSADDGVLVSVHADNAAAVQDAEYLAIGVRVGKGEPISDTDLLRAGNVVASPVRGKPKAKAAAARAMKRLRGSTGIPDPGGYAHAPVDPILDGVDHRQRVLDDHPFPAELTPSGFRLKSDAAIFDGRETLGRDVTFLGPDDEDTISYYPLAMYADDVLEYWKHTETDLLDVENLGPRTYCATDHIGSTPSQDRVSCVAAFDGMAVIAESVNSSREGSVEAAVRLLRAGVEHWKSIRD